MFCKKPLCEALPSRARQIQKLDNSRPICRHPRAFGKTATRKMASATGGPTKAELPDSATVVISESKGPKTEATLLRAKRRKRGRGGGRQLGKQKLSAENANHGRKLSPERMRIVLDSLAEHRLLSLAAAKAGIHRKTLEYWINRSAAGDPGYDVEWQGLIGDFTNTAHQRSLRPTKSPRRGVGFLDGPYYLQDR
jgi:hypothetical protein